MAMFFIFMLYSTSSLMMEAVRTSETSVDNHFTRQYIPEDNSEHHSSLMMEAVRTSETSVDNYFTRQYIPEDNSEHHTRRRENLKSQKQEHSLHDDLLHDETRERLPNFVRGNAYMTAIRVIKY
jgi:hypothetical protein